jgi:hypothetical protein
MVELMMKKLKERRLAADKAAVREKEERTT